MIDRNRDSSCMPHSQIGSAAGMDGSSHSWTAVRLGCVVALALTVNLSRGKKLILFVARVMRRFRMIDIDGSFRDF